jgi:hypothetical protein
MVSVLVRKPTPEQKVLLEGCPIWEHDVATFPSKYDDREETCLIIEGKAYVESSKGDRVYFTVGDLVTFAPNLVCTWTILDKIRKHYIFDMEH